MEYKYCQHCGSQIPASAEVCMHCGKPCQSAEKATKFCQHCGKVIDKDCVICPHCGKQVAELNANQQPNIVINNANANINGRGSREKNKWVAFFLCLFLGWSGAHRFYEGKIGTGILWLCSGGILGVGWLIDFIIILTKPNPYYV